MLLDCHFVCVLIYKLSGGWILFFKFKFEVVCLAEDVTVFVGLGTCLSCVGLNGNFHFDLFK